MIEIKNTVLIIAAGMGSRLRPYTSQTPKSIIDINGMTMLGQSLFNLNEINNSDNIIIDKVLICIGYLKEKIKQYVNSLELKNINVEFIENPLYATLNNNFSVWLAHSHITDQQLVLINGDIFYDKQILISTFLSRYENLSVIDSTKPLPEDGMKVLVNDENRIIAFSKTYYNGFGCTVGIHKFSTEGTSLFLKKIYDHLENGINTFHHKAIDDLIKSNELDHYALDVNGFEWIEIDDVTDLQSAKENYFEEL